MTRAEARLQIGYDFSVTCQVWVYLEVEEDLNNPITAPGGVECLNVHLVVNA